MHATTFAETTDLTPQTLKTLIGNATLKAGYNGWTAEDVTYRLYARPSAVQKSPRSITIRFDFDHLGLDERWTCWKVVTGTGKHRREQWFSEPEQAIEVGKQAGYGGKLVVRVPRRLRSFEVLCERVEHEINAYPIDPPPNRYRRKPCDWYELILYYGQRQVTWPLSDDGQVWAKRDEVLFPLLVEAYLWRKPFAAWVEEREEAANDFTEAQLHQFHAEATELVLTLRKLFGSDYREFVLAAWDC